MIKIIYTENNCTINGYDYPPIPMLLDINHNVIWPITDWLRHLLVIKGNSISTVENWADILKSFTNFLLKTNTMLDNVSDETLLLWRNSIMKKTNESKARANYKLQRVYSFYAWAQRNGYFSDIIGEASNEHRFPISINIRKSQFGKNILSSDLIYNRPSPRKRITLPTDDQIENVLSHLPDSNNELLLRNILIWEWAETVGLRRSEITGLELKDFPDQTTIDEYDTQEKTYPLIIRKEISKGNKERVVHVLPSLIDKTLDWCNIERKEILKSKGLTNRESKNIFISQKTGRALKPRSLSNIFYSASKSAGTRVWLHGGRHKFATTQTKERLQALAEVEGNFHNNDTITVIIKELLGHAKMSTTEEYIHLAQEDLEAMSLAVKTVYDKSKLKLKSHDKILTEGTLIRLSSFLKEHNICPRTAISILKKHIMKSD